MSSVVPLVKASDILEGKWLVAQSKRQKSAVGNTRKARVKAWCGWKCLCRASWKWWGNWPSWAFSNVMVGRSDRTRDWRSYFHKQSHVHFLPSDTFLPSLADDIHRLEAMERENRVTAIYKWQACYNMFFIVGDNIDNIDKSIKDNYYSTASDRVSFT